MHIEIEPHCGLIGNEGLGKVKFGIDKDGLRARLGPPDEIEGPNSPREDWETWWYNDLFCSFSFGADFDDLMGRIYTDNPDVTLLGVPELIGSRYEDVLAKITNIGLGRKEQDDYGEGLGWEIAFPDRDLCMNFDPAFDADDCDSPLLFITWSAPFDEDGDNIVWPSAGSSSNRAT